MIKKLHDIYEESFNYFAENNRGFNNDRAHDFAIACVSKVEGQEVDLTLEEIEDIRRSKLVPVARAFAPYRVPKHSIQPPVPPKMTGHAIEITFNPEQKENVKELLDEVVKQLDKELKRGIGRHLS